MIGRRKLECRRCVIMADALALFGRRQWAAICLGLLTCVTATSAEAADWTEDAATLIDRAVANGDEHAIKFTEACFSRHILAPSPIYLAAIRHAIGIVGSR